MALDQLRRCVALLSTWALICQLVQLPTSLPVSAYSITSQYLGAAPSRGNEHLLLFKLPDTISSQLLEQQQQQPRLLLQHPNSRQYVQQQQQIQSTPRLKYEQPLSSPLVQEQAISLTIPLSTLHTVEPQQQHQATPPLQSYAAPAHEQTKQVALELALADYLGGEGPRGQSAAPPQDLQQVIYAPPEQQNSLVASGRNFSQQLVASSSYSSPQQAGEPQQLEQQPSLWRDTQAAQLATHQPPPPPPPESSYNNQSEIVSLISKLSNSSPDLLLRLRNLLKRAAAQHQLNSLTQTPFNQSSYSTGLRPFERSARHFVPTDGNYDANNNELLMANNVAPSELKNLVYNYITGQQQQAGSRGAESGAAQSSLSAFLANQNVSSHEEIKIPLIVIAMPRILSLKRNQSALASSQQVNNNSSGSQSSLPTITSELAHHLSKQQLPQLFAAANSSSPLMTNALLNETIATYNNNSNNNNNQFYNLSQPARYGAPSASAINNATQSYWIGQQTSATTMAPLYTMAPYAHHQFVMPRLAAAPLIREFLPMHHNHHHHHHHNNHHQLQQLNEPTQTTSYYTQVKQLAPQYNSNQSVYFAADSPRPLVSAPTMIVGRPSGIVNASSLPYSGQNVQIHLIDSPDQDQQVPMSRQKSAGPFHFVQRQQQQPLYEFQPDLELPNVESQPQQQQQQQLLYLNPLPQRRVVLPEGRVYNLTDEPSADHSKFKSYLTELQARPQQQSRLSLIEEQIRNLRPLFQASKRASGGNLYSQGGEHQHRFSPSQMLSLLTKSSERRNSDEQQEPATTTEDNKSQLQGSKGLQKKSTKMVLMIV